MSTSQKNNTRKRVNHTNQNLQQNTPNPLLLLPFILTIIIVPLIIRLAEVDNQLEELGWHGSNPTTSDLFLYYKCIAFLVFCAIMLITLVVYRINSKRKFIKSPIYIPLLVYAVCIILSTMVSEHVKFSLRGIENHFESVFVLLGYCLCVFYASYFVTSERHLKWVLNGWLIGTILLVIIGVGQAFRIDIFMSDFIKYVILPSDMWEGTPLRLKFPLGKVYITLYNPNYIGYFGCLTIPIFLVMTLVSKKTWQKAIWGTTLVGLLICLFGSEAKNGMIGLSASILVLLIAFRKKFIKFWPYILGSFALFLVAFFGINAIKDDYLIESIKIAFSSADIQVDTKLQAIETQKDCIAFKYDDELLYFEMEMLDDSSTSATFSFVDSTGNKIPYRVNSDKQSLSVDDERFPFTVQLIKYSDIPCCQITIENTNWVFSNKLDSEGYYYLNSIGKWVPCVPSESAVFTNYPYLASTRGYIWAKSIPLLKQNFLLGSGPDTFVFEFPQMDYASAVPVGLAGMVVSKPHNLYLQMGVQTGVISMIAFIVFYLLYMILTIRQYWKHKLDTLFSQVGVAICAATFGYMVSGLANDSTVTYSFVYWGLMGLGIAVNHLSKQEDERLLLEAQKATNQEARKNVAGQKNHPGKKHVKKS